MPTKEDVARIESNFARQYDLDLAGIYKDAASLRTALAARPAANQSLVFTYNGSEAFVPDLETIDASQVVPDQRLSLRQIEANLDEASKYLQACQQLRGQYGELAKNRNDTRFKGEEFVRLDKVHLEEIDAGLYSLPWKEAADEAVGLELATAQAKAQQSIPEEMTGPGNAQKYSSLLSDPGMSSQIDANSFITKNVANRNNDQVGQRALSTSAYRTYMELAQWQNTLAGAKSAVSQLTAKLSITKRREEYLRKDEQFRLERAFISRQLAWLQIAEHCRHASELNYDERLKATRSLFNENFGPLIERTVVLKEGLNAIYGIDIPIGSLTKGNGLDQIAVWLITASEALSKWKRTKRLTLVQISASRRLTIAADGKSFEAEFTVDEAMLPSADALLRGVNFEFVGDARDPLSLSASPPAGVLLGGNPGPLQFGRICSVAPGLELRPQHSDLLWNGSPKGVWKVTSSVAKIDAIIMYVWVIST